MRFVRDHAGDRGEHLEWHLLVQMVVVTNDRHAATKDLIARFGADMTVDDALETPFLLVGTVAEIAEQLVQARQSYGFSYITVHEPFMEAFAPVIDRLRR